MARVTPIGWIPGPPVSDGYPGLRFRTDTRASGCLQTGVGGTFLPGTDFTRHRPRSAADVAALSAPTSRLAVYWRGPGGDRCQAWNHVHCEIMTPVIILMFITARSAAASKASCES